MILVVVVALPLFGTTLHAQSTVVATPSTHNVTINGEVVDIRAYNIGGNNFVRLRDLAYVLNGTQAQLSVNWFQYPRPIILTPGQPYTPVGGERPGRATFATTALSSITCVQIFDDIVSLQTYTVHGTRYFMLRDLARRLNFDVDWDEATSAVLINTSQPYVNARARQAIEDFLVQFISIFSFGYGMDSNALVRFDRENAFAQGRETSVFFDNQGNPIYDAPFILGDMVYASRFSIYDLDGDGIPEIFITFLEFSNSLGLTVIYRLIDGEFTPIRYYDCRGRFIRDAQGRLILFFNDVKDGSIFGYRLVTFAGDKLVTEHLVTKPIIELTHDDVWEVTSSWDEHHNSPEFWLNPTIYGKDIPFSFIPRMRILENEITTSIKERLGIE